MPRVSPAANAAPRQLVTLHLDGAEVAAREGEPVAAALVAAGHLVLARSPKYHRPRGPACFRAACDGCLLRVDGSPNALSCQVAAREGMKLASQNHVGSREVDLLRVTDWFFPKGMNHHELFAGVPGVSSIMQSFARRVAGLGTLPDAPGAARPARRRAVDALVVGAGAGGLAAAAALARAGKQVEVVDDALEPGGSARAMAGAAGAALRHLVETSLATLRGARAAVRVGTTAGAVFGPDVLLAGPDGAELVAPRTLVLASGLHDGALAFPGNDLPGLFSARAAGLLFAHDVVPGERVLALAVPGAAGYAAALADAARARGVEIGFLAVDAVDEVHGSGRVKGVTVTVAGERRKLAADALALDAPGAPAYELAAQAGAELAFGPSGYTPRAGTSGTGDAGRIGRGVFLAGELAGLPLDAEALAADADRVAALARADAPGPWQGGGA